MGSLKGVPHRKWTKEEKLRIVKMHIENHISIREIEKKEHVRNGLVSTWCKRYVEEGEASLEPHKGNKFSALHTSKSLSEVERLRLIILKQELELARLKKGYFVRGVGANKEYVIGKGQILKSSKPSK